VVGKLSDTSIYDCAPQLCYRHRAKRDKCPRRDLASRRLRAYEPDGLDGSVLWPRAYTHRHADSDDHRFANGYRNASNANGNGYRNASNADANGNVHFYPKTIPNSKVRSTTKTSPHSSASSVAGGELGGTRCSL
jgi:hypothetical protein